VPDANEKGPLTDGQRTRIGEASPIKPAWKSHRRRPKAVGLVKPELLSQLCRITWQSSVRSYQTLC